jgi:hypothetical protein
VFGELAPVTLSIRPGGLGEITGVLSRERRGAELLGHLGITLRDDDDDGAESGLIVESFPPGSLADLSGVHKGDRIVALGPMRVDEVSDVIPPPTARSVELVIERPGLTQPIRAVVSLSPTVSGPDQRAVYGATFAVGLAVLLLLLVSPAARVTAKVFRALSTPSPSSLLSLVPASAPGEPSARSRLVRMIWVAVAFSAVVLAFGVLPFVTRMLPGTIDVAVLAAACVTLSAGVEAARRRVVGGRGYAVLRAVFLGVPAVAAVAAVALPLGSFRLEMFSAAQGGEPWAWLGLSSLPGLLGLPAAVISLLLVPTSTTMGTTALVLDRQRIFVGASLLSIVFLGGFRLPFVAGDPLLSTPAIRVAAALAFVAKALIVVVIASRLRSAALSSRALAWVSYISASLAVGAALLVSMLPFLTPPPWAVGPVAVVVVSTIALVALVRARRADAAPAPRGLLLFS